LKEKAKINVLRDGDEREDGGVRVCFEFEFRS
jgi:hypothetical protein